MATIEELKSPPTLSLTTIALLIAAAASARLPLLRGEVASVGSERASPLVRGDGRADNAAPARDKDAATLLQIAKNVLTRISKDNLSWWRRGWPSTR